MCQSTERAFSHKGICCFRKTQPRFVFCLLKAQFTLQIHPFSPYTYVWRLFWYKLLTFGDTDHRKKKLFDAFDLWNVSIDAIILG